MRLAVFVKPEHEGRVSHVNTASVRTGLGNTLGRVTCRNISAWSTRTKCVFNKIEFWARIFVLLQETRGLLVSPFSSTEHLSGLLTATWPLEVRKSWGTLCVFVDTCLCDQVCVVLFDFYVVLKVCMSVITYLWYVMFRRNQNFVDILRLLCLGEKNSAFDISLRFTHLFWCGDLNYRLDLDVQVGPTVVIYLFF